MNKTKIIILGIIAVLLIVIVGLVWNIGRNQKPSDEIVNKLTDSFGNSQISSAPDFGSAGTVSLQNSLQTFISNPANSEISSSLNFSSGRLDQSFLTSQNSSSSDSSTISNSMTDITYSNSISTPIFLQSPLAQKIATRSQDTVNFGEFKIGEITYQANLQLAPDGSAKIKISLPESRPITIASPKLTNIFIENIENTNENGVFSLTQRLGNGVRVDTTTYRIDLKKAVENPEAEIILDN